MGKILYLITQSDFGGAQRYVYDLATNLSQNSLFQGDKFDIIVAGGESASDQRDKQGHNSELAQKLHEKDIRYIYLSHLKRVISPWHDLLAFWQIVKLIKTEKPNIVHLNSSKISILGSLAAQLIRIKFASNSHLIRIIYTVHGWVFQEELPWWKRTFYRVLEKWTARFKTHIICLSEFDKQTAVKQRVVPANKISVIYNGIKPIDFLPRDEARKRLGIPDNTILIGAIANLYKTKGLKYLIQAISQLSGVRCQVSIVGEGPEHAQLENLIQQNKLTDTVILTGNIPNAAQLLPAFDIYVCSSIKEGLPYTILEAMQSGLPIVSTRVGAIPEVIADGENSLLIETKNSAQIAEKIKYLIAHPNIAKRLGEEARKDVLEKFGLERMIKKTKEVYKK